MSAHPTRAGLEAAARNVTLATGLAFPPERMDDFTSGMAAAANELGFPDADAAVSALTSGPISPEQAEILARHLTVGETYFFRGKRFMEALRGSILPLAIKRHAADRRLRIWSAGCASGEEPYTIAMIIDGMIGDRASWDISITATDINRSMLKKAERGMYGRWSFRGCPAALRRRYFHDCGAQEEIAPEIRRMVGFSFHNLAVDEFPRALDIIVCTNVLMYLSGKARSRVLKGFRDSLLPGGFLLVSPTEASMPQEAGFVPVKTGGQVAFAVGPAAPPQEGPVLPGKEIRMPPPVFATPALGASRRKPREPREALEALLDRARLLADQGDLAQALQTCRAAIAVDKSRAASHRLEATILEEMGRGDEAASSLRKALYIDPDSVMAHLSLGILARRTGKTALAERHFRNVIQLLTRFGDGDVVPGSDGLTAAGVRELARGYTPEPRDGTPAGSRI